MCVCVCAFLHAFLAGGGNTSKELVDCGMMSDCLSEAEQWAKLSSDLCVMVMMWLSVMVYRSLWSECDHGSWVCCYDDDSWRWWMVGEWEFLCCSAELGDFDANIHCAGG